MSLSEIPHLKHCRPAQNAAITRCFHSIHKHTVHSCTHVYCLMWRWSKWSIPDIQERNLMMRALKEFGCKGSSWLLLIPWFFNTYNVYIWGGHTEYIVPFPTFKYFIWKLDVVITVCIQIKIILLQFPTTRSKQKDLCSCPTQIFKIGTKLLSCLFWVCVSVCETVFYCVSFNITYYQENHYDNRNLKTCP